MPDDRTWGLWGGVAPGGWCQFKVAEGGNHWGSAHVGTQDEAIAGAAVFERERSKYASLRHTPTTYTPQLFDATREPAFVDATPTPAQWRLLDIFRRFGTFNTRELPSDYDDAADVCHHNGWYMHTVGVEPGVRLTAAGERAWQAGKPR